MVPHQRLIARHVERPARHDDLGRKGQGAGGVIHQPQKIAVLRLRREGVDVLTADGQENPLRGSCQRCDGGLNVCHMCPAVTLPWHPGRTFQRDQRRAGGRASSDGIAAHLRGKGVRGVDHMGDPLGLKVGAKPRHPAKSADPHVDRLAHRRLGPPGVGVDARKPRLRDGLRHKVRLGRAAQKQDACHG